MSLSLFFLYLGRIDRCVYLGTPSDAESQANILRALTRKLPLSPTVNIPEIVSHCPEGVTGADMSALTTDAALEAARKAVARLESEWETWSLARQRKRDVIRAAMEAKATLELVLIPVEHSNDSISVSQESFPEESTSAAAASTSAVAILAAADDVLRSLHLADYREALDALEPVPLAEYVKEHASAASVQVLIEQEDFLKAAKTLVPSLSKEQLDHYQILRKQFSQIQ